MVCSRRLLYNIVLTRTLRSGPGTCIGRPLALQEFRLVLSALIRNFDFAFAPGFTKKEWLDSLRDQYLLTRGVLPMILKRRPSAQA
jgi:cytochrome P450